MRSPRRLFQLTVLFVTGAILTSCGMVNKSTIRQPMESNRPPGFGSVQGELYKAHDQWQGTPYVLGGSDVNGVDCSSYMQIVFSDHFGISMPRHTTEQLRTGRSVQRTSLKPGDLVFFRTSRDELHVGVVVSETEFMHASTSSGVMISGLGEPYWATRYLSGRRIL